MTTLENPSSQSRETHFAEALVDRFFNPKSYFLHSFLAALRKREQFIDEPNHVVTTGLLMDEIINSRDKLALLGRLDQMDGFRRYHEQFNHGIGYLHNSRLSTQQMMEIVGALGNSLADTFMDLVSNEVTRPVLLDTLGLDSNLAASTTKPSDSGFSNEAAPPASFEIDTLSQAAEDLFNEQEKEPFALLEKEEYEGSVEEADHPAATLADSEYQIAKDELAGLSLETVAQDLETWEGTQTQTKDDSLQLEATDVSAAKESLEIGSALQNEMGGLETQPWSFFQDDVNEKLQSLRKNLNRFSGNPDDWKSFKRIKIDFRDLRDWAMIQGDQGIEAISHKALRLFETVYLKGIENRHVITRILADACDALRMVNDAGSGSERLDIVRLMVHQIDHQRRAYPKELGVQAGHHEAMPEKEEPEKKTPNNQDGPFQNVREAPSVESHSAGEPKSPEWPEVQPSSVQSHEPELHSENELMDFPGRTDATDQEEENEAPENFDSIRESELLPELMSEQGEDFAELEIQEDEASDESEKESGLLDAVGRSTESLKDFELSDVGTHVDNSMPVDISLPQDASEEAEKEPYVDLNLPGEEDEELLAILGDIKEERETNLDRFEGTDRTNQISEEKNQSDFDLQLDKLEGDYEKITAKTDFAEFDDKSGSHRLSSEEDGGSKLPEMQDSGDGFDFVSEAEMYFSFSRRALQNLMRNPTDPHSLEDSELAFYSLKILAEKLGYGLASRIMAAAENLVQQTLGVKSGVNAVQVNTLYTVITEIEQAGREQKLNEPARRVWLEQQEATLQGWVDSPSATPQEVDSVPPVATENRSIAGDDPLDFLLFDDTSKYFKQLLKE